MQFKKYEIARIFRKINSTLFRLRLFRPLTDLSHRKHLISSLIFPIFEYSCAMFCDIKDGHSDKLQLLLNSCVRYTVDLKNLIMSQCIENLVGGFQLKIGDCTYQRLWYTTFLNTKLQATFILLSHREYLFSLYVKKAPP